ncbi:MAG TPA: hypothetical protein EYG86_00460 [Crocinitomicaceae bacterium]|nr:hypothetical protein [Crocinitomicaceae bacterium]
MNKTVYISIICIGLIFASCQKETIVPVGDVNAEVPTWNLEKELEQHDDSATNPDIVDPENEETLDGDITDPNNDPDGKEGKKRK